MCKSKVAVACHRNLLAFLVLLPTGKYVAVHHQVTLPMWIIILVLASQAWLSTQIQISGNVIMVATVVAGALLGSASSLLLCGAYMLASRFPPIYVQVFHPSQVQHSITVTQ